MAIDILPDSRSREAHGSIRSPYGNMIPVYCANCHKPWGMVSEKHMTFAFVLCDPCAEKMGPIANTYVEPDRVFWERVQEESKNERMTSILAREWQKKLGE